MIFFLFFVIFILKLSLSIWFFLILSWLRIYLCNFFSLKHCELLWCVFHVFFMIFSKIICLFFFNIELVKNYNYNKAKSFGESVVVFLTKHMDCYSISLNGFLFYFIGESTVVFLTKHCQLLQRFSSLVFFFQNYLCWFFFIYILSW